MICLLYYNMHQLSNKNNNYLYLNNSKNINYLHLYNDKNTNYLHLNNSKNTNNMHVKLELSYKLSEKPLQFPPQFPIIKSNKKNQKRNTMKKEYRELKDLLDYINASREEKDEIKGKSMQCCIISLTVIFHIWKERCIQAGSMVVNI